MKANIKADIIALAALYPLLSGAAVIEYLRVAVVEKKLMTFREYSDIHQELKKLGIGTDIKMSDLLRLVNPPNPHPAPTGYHHFQ
jgi:hypothetical protein